MPNNDVKHAVVWGVGGELAHKPVQQNRGKGFHNSMLYAGAPVILSVERERGTYNSHRVARITPGGRRRRRRGEP